MNERINNQDYSISLIRLIATGFIVTCHILQYTDSPLAWWFNVGVQIFLCISGFLYGKRKKITNEIAFYKKQFLKILIDYYLVILAAILLLFFFARKELSGSAVIKSLLTYGTLPGGGHLWYIPYCLLCYFLTPFLSQLFENTAKSRLVLLTAILFAAVFVLSETFFRYFNGAWIICYILGFFLGNIFEREDCRKMYAVTSVMIVALAILANTVQIVQDYFVKYELTGILGAFYSRFRNYAHVLLGTAIFILLKSLFSKIILKNGFMRPVKTVCNYSDKFSYDIYLTHMFFISGPFSLLNLTPMRPINICLIIVCTVISAVLVRFVSSAIQKNIFGKGQLRERS